MFEFKCFEYLKEIEQHPNNETLLSEFKSFLVDNKDKVEQFIIQNTLQPNQKQLLLEILQSLDTSQNSNQEVQVMNQNQQVYYGNLSQDDFSNYILQQFEEWKTEYFKLRDVTPKCVSIVEKIVNEQLLQHFELIDLVVSLPIDNNDAFRKFKNQILNVLAVTIIESIDDEIVNVRNGKGNIIKKMLLRYKFEKEQLKIAKKQFNLKSLEELVTQAKQLRGEI